MKDNLFNHININFDNLHIPNGEEPDADKACSDYDQIIEELAALTSSFWAWVTTDISALMSQQMYSPRVPTA